MRSILLGALLASSAAVLFQAAYERFADPEQLSMAARVDPGEVEGPELESGSASPESEPEMGMALGPDLTELREPAGKLFGGGMEAAAPGDTLNASDHLSVPAEQDVPTVP